MELKNFVDFAYSMINMEEVKNGVFQVPQEIIFNLDPVTHRKIHKSIKKEKGSDEYLNLEQEFDVEIFGITFKFK